MHLEIRAVCPSIYQRICSKGLLHIWHKKTYAKSMVCDKYSYPHIFETRDRRCYSTRDMTLREKVI